MTAGLIDAIHRQHDRELRHVAGIAVLVGFVIGVVTVLLLGEFTPRCHEDEVIVWNDVVNRHTECRVFDDLLEEESGR